MKKIFTILLSILLLILICFTLLNKGTEKSKVDVMNTVGAITYNNGTSIESKTDLSQSIKYTPLEIEEKLILTEKDLIFGVKYGDFMYSKEESKSDKWGYNSRVFIGNSVIEGTIKLDQTFDGQPYLLVDQKDLNKLPLFYFSSIDNSYNHLPSENRYNNVSVVSLFVENEPYDSTDKLYKKLIQLKGKHITVKVDRYYLTSGIPKESITIPSARFVEFVSN